MSNAAKNFNILETYLSVLHNYFDNYFEYYLIQQNYFSNPSKILDLSVKPFFPCSYNYNSENNFVWISKELYKIFKLIR